MQDPLLILVAAAFLLAGFVKGVIGLGLPTVSMGLLAATLALDPAARAGLAAAQATVRRIVEDRDASPSERAIDEIYTGVLAAPTALLAAWVARLTPHNAQNEYYLTDVVAASVADGVTVDAVVAPDERDTRGINDRVQLGEVERIVQRRLAETLMRAGAAIADPARFDVRGTLACGDNVSIDVGCVFESRVALGDGVRVGPYCMLRDTDVGAGTEVLAYSMLQSKLALHTYPSEQPHSSQEPSWHSLSAPQVSEAAQSVGA